MRVRMSSLTALLVLGSCVAGADAAPFARIGLPTIVLSIAEQVPARASDTPTDSSKSQDRVYLGNEPIESCMKRWDADTHMTKDAWRASCRRITEERAPYVKGE